MNRKFKIIFLLALPLVLLAVILIVVFVALPMLKHRNLEATHVAIMQAPHVCLPGTTERVERWGSTGYSRFCMKDDLKHGSFVAWQGRRKMVEGQFLNGKEDGVWVYLDDDGSATRIIEYSEGKAVSDSGKEPRAQPKTVP